MIVLNKVKQLLQKADAKRTGINVYTMQPDENMKDARIKAKELGNTGLFFITVYPPDMNYYKIKFIKSLPNYEELNETKSLNQILNEHKETITDPDELKRWNSLPGESK